MDTSKFLTAYNVRTKEKNCPIHDAVISRTAKGAYIAQGHDGKGNRLTKLLAEQYALAAIEAGVAKMFDKASTYIPDHAKPMKKETNTTTKGELLQDILSGKSLDYILLAKKYRCSINDIKRAESSCKNMVIQMGEIRVGSELDGDEYAVNILDKENRFIAKIVAAPYYSYEQEEQMTKYFCQAVNERQKLLDSNKSMLLMLQEEIEYLDNWMEQTDKSNIMFTHMKERKEFIQICINNAKNIQP